jgi:glycosyltransferase involved in cell wall biosynthesis/SAM-dependent methyltransferase
VSDQFYKAFEDKYRGSRELIKLRMRVYLPFTQPLLQIYPKGEALDLGCGRGEWLELISEQGFIARGVDIDDGMLQACRDRGLLVEIADAVTHLQSLPTDSVCIISGFHIAEHLPFNVLQQLFVEALRVLTPGGLLILETPNPENIEVGTNSFYLDPTHERPIPPKLLSFLAEHYGYQRWKVLRLQESDYLRGDLNPAIMRIIDGVSPDYAVIAQKLGSKLHMDLLAPAFGQSYGLTLHTLADRYQQALDQRFELIEAKIQKAEDTSHQLEAQILALYNSKSWRITKPLRWTAQQWRLILQFGFRSRAKAFVAKIKNKLVHIVVARSNSNTWTTRLGNWLVFNERRKTLVKNNPIDLAMRTPTKAISYDLNTRVFPSRPSLPESLLLNHSSDLSPSWIRLTGHLEGHYSLAIVNRNLVAALDRVNNHRCNYVPHHGDSYDEMPKLPKEQAALVSGPLNRRMPLETANDVISVVSHYPFIKDKLPAEQRGILFFWEETSVPSETVRFINDHFHLVWVAARSVKKSLLNSGCKTPIFVMPIGVDHLAENSKEPLDLLQVKPGEYMRFLHISSVFERKGPDVLLSSFLDAFTADDAVELYIKTFPNPHNHIRQLLDTLLVNYNNPARIIIDEDPLEEDRLLALYRSAHAMVLPTRGEGFNLPAAEAMAMGIPVITTGSSAQVDFCCNDTALLVKFNFAPSRSHLHASDACWLEPSRLDLKIQLQKLRQQILISDQALELKRERARSLICENYTWKNAAQGIIKTANWLKSRPKDDHDLIRLAVISPWATRCGIAEYSHELLSSMMDPEKVQLSVFCDTRTEVPPADSEVSWTVGNSDSVTQALQKIGIGNHQVVLIQHQPSLFPLTDACCMQMAALSAQGIVVMLELHATLPLLDELRLSNTAVQALMKIDRVIVHKPEDLNNLLVFGLADNVMLMPLGVVQPLEENRTEAVRKELEIPDDALVLGFFGFAFEHKGIDTLIKTIKPLELAIGRRVHLLAVSSTLDKRSENLIKCYQNLSIQLEVDKNVHWVNDYHPIEECQRLLSIVDCIIFPYKDTRESASAAVTVGLSTLRPVLVSPSEIFSDLNDLVFKMKGHDVEHIVYSVQSLITQPNVIKDRIQSQREWLNQRDWKNLSNRLHTLMRSLCRERKFENHLRQARFEWESNWALKLPKQILVDVSELYYRDALTGIQRVVRSILNELFRQPPEGYEIFPVYGNKSLGFYYTSKFDPEHKVSLRDGEPVRVESGDIFLGLDLTAHLFPEAEQQLKEFRLVGAKVYYVVYDIIPLRHPHLTVANISQTFEVWLRSLMRSTDGLVCISKTVAKDVADWMLEQATDIQPPRIGHFHLGADIEKSTPSKGLPVEAEGLFSKLSTGICFLMVGTIEPRKGHAQILSAFDLLWAQGVNCSLVLVGKQGWSVDELSQTMRQHPKLEKKLFWLESASDEYLTKIYDRADCLIAASECEGFGLPLIEAAQHRLPIIARDIPVFREVATEHAFFFKGGEPLAIAKSILNWLNLYEQDLHPKSDNMPRLSWEESTKQLLQALNLSSKTEHLNSINQNK